MKIHVWHFVALAYKRIFGRYLSDMKGSVQNLVFHLRDFRENSRLDLRGNGLQTYICRDLSDMNGSVQKEHRTLFALSCSLFKGLSRKSVSGTR